jgi:hypothetical protein
VTLAVAAPVIFFRWFGGEQRADRAVHSATGSGLSTQPHRVAACP